MPSSRMPAASSRRSIGAGAVRKNPSGVLNWFFRAYYEAHSQGGTNTKQVEAMVMINVMYALEPDYRKRLWPVLAARLEPAGLLVFTWRDGGPPQPHPLRELDSRQVGRHTYTVLSEILESGEEAFRARYVYRITKHDKVISEEEITGQAFRPAWGVIQRELVSSGFTQTDAADGLLAWRLA